MGRPDVDETLRKFGMALAPSTPIKLVERTEGDNMPVKPNGAVCSIREQIVEDPATGLILQFECEQNRTRLTIAGSALPFGNREIIFDKDGKEAAAGTFVGEFRRPSWLRKVD
jgi:hypothetical protein